MSNKRFEEIIVPQNIDDMIEETVKQAMRDKKNIQIQKNKECNKLKKRFGVVAASFIAVLGVGMLNPAIASKLPIIGSVFEAIQEGIFLSGDYTQYATLINETVTSNGVDVTLSEVLCDGQFLYVTYRVERKTPFKYTSWDGSSALDMNQLLIQDDDSYVSFSEEMLDSTGFSGLEGKFIDENTFIGVQQFDLASLETEIPDEFVFQTKINRIENSAINAGDKSDVTKGTWAFKVPVTVNKELKKVIKLDGVSTNDIRVNTISMTPFNTRVNVTIQDEDTSRYDIYIFDEHGNKLEWSQVKDRSNNQFEYIYNSIEPNSSHLRIVALREIWDENSEGTYTHNENEVLLDTTISLVNN